jgi:hypothetical protein
MVSTKKFGGLEITIGAGGLRFKKRKSAFNIAVGECMKASGVTPAGAGRYSKKFQKQFIECVDKNSRGVKPSVKARYGL